MTAKKIFLHAGCGLSSHAHLAALFPPAEWSEVRLDIDPGVAPDIVADITKMDPVASNSCDALFSQHTLEHLHSHQVDAALREFLRVLRPGGYALLRVPNMQEVAAEIAQGNLDGALYQSPAGPICAIDIVYGWRQALADGNEFMAHHTAFTPATLGQALVRAGFADALVRTDGLPYSMEGVGYKRQ